MLETIRYGVARRHSLIRLLPDDPVIEPIIHFLRKHDCQLPFKEYR